MATALRVCAVLIVAVPVQAGVDVWRWIPSATRVVVQVDPAAPNQARARDVLGVEGLMARFATPPRLSKLEQVTIAYVPADPGTGPVAFAHGTRALTNEFARLRGKELETTDGRAMFGVRSPSGAAALLEPECVAEGPRAALANVLSHASNAAQTLAGIDSEAAKRLVRRPAAGAAPVSLLYVAPPGGADLYAMIEELDRVFGAEMRVALQPYQKPIQLLGPAHAARLDLRQDGSELDTTLWLAMPNRMAAQIASVSLDASRDMVRMAARNAVKSGSMSADEAKLLEAALATLATQADGELVRVSLRVPDTAPVAP
jgi:hypothetical protein